MNKNIIKAFALFGAVFSMSACTSDMEFKDSQVSAITQLYEPADGKSVTLQASATAFAPLRGGVLQGRRAHTYL